MLRLLLFWLFYTTALSYGSFLYAAASEQVLSVESENEFFDGNAGIDPYSLSLEQLLKIQVSSTSRANTEAKTSEGIITVITADEITLFGAKNLVDILQRLPATLINADALTPRDVVSVRGDRPIVGDHVLFLINGRPFRITAFAASATRMLLYGFPIKQIKQIEFIQGSASVLYGANAYSAVINIITKKPEDGADYIAGTLGENKARQLQFNAQIMNDSLSANIAGNYFNSDGWDAQFLDSDSTIIQHNLTHDNIALWAELSFADIKVSAYSNQLEGNYYGLKTPFGVNEPFEDEVQYLDLSYLLYSSTRVNTKLSLSSVWYESLTAKSNELNYDFENHIQFSNSKLLLGANLTQVVNAESTTDLASFQLDDFSSDLYSVFSHYNYRYHDTNFIVGAMWLKFSELDSQWVPRLGIVHQFTPQWVLKVLYNEGYRAPNAIETSLNIFDGLATGNKFLEPEHIETYESQLSFSKNEYHLALSAFKSTQDQLINFVSVTDEAFPIKFFNSETREFIGGVLEARYRYQRWDIQSSYSYQTNNRTQIITQMPQVEDITQIPQSTFKLGVSYKRGSYSISVFDTYSSKFPYNELDSSARVNKTAGAEHNISLNTIWNFTQYFEGLSLSLYINNLLDEDLYVKQFETTANSINSYPHETSRAAYLTLNYQF